MLARVVRRAQRAPAPDMVAVATTSNPADDAVHRLCEARGWPCFRGSEEDVLDRYYQAARFFGADAVVRVTSDCPLLDPEVLELTVQAFLQRQPRVEYVSNTWPRRTYPRGLDTEVVAFRALERAWRDDRDPATREHVTPFIYGHPDRFVLHGVTRDRDLSSFRWTVDTPEDLAFVRRVYEHFAGDEFTTADVVALLEKHPDWLDINRHVHQKGT